MERKRNRTFLIVVEALHQSVRETGAIFRAQLHTLCFDALKGWGHG